MNHQPNDDLIDFPCSDTWLAYYHARGLTCRAPVAESRTGQEAEDDYLYAENVRLRRELASKRLEARLAHERLMIQNQNKKGTKRGLVLGDEKQE